MGGFERWSQEHLGQGHYLLGYLIVLSTHNWLLLLALALTLWCGARLYIRPTRPRVLRLFAALLFGLAYEYQKHIAGELHSAVNFLLIGGLAALNQAAHTLIGWIIPGVIYGLIGTCIAVASWHETRQPAT